MNHRMRLKRQNAMRRPRQHAALRLTLALQAFQLMLPPLCQAFQEMAFTAERAARASNELNIALNAARELPADGPLDPFLLVGPIPSTIAVAE
jgi:hypothetical protein